MSYLSLVESYNTGNLSC